MIRFLLFICLPFLLIILSISACQEEEDPVKVKISDIHSTSGFCTDSDIVVQLSSSSTFEESTWFADGQKVGECNNQYACVLSFSSAGSHEIRVEAKSKEGKTASTSTSTQIEARFKGLLGEHRLARTSFNFSSTAQTYVSNNSLSYTRTDLAGDQSIGTVSGSITIASSSNLSCLEGTLTETHTFTDDEDIFTDSLSGQSQYNIEIMDSNTLHIEQSNGSFGCEGNHSFSFTSSELTLPFLAIHSFDSRDRCGSNGTGVWAL